MTQIHADEGPKSRAAFSEGPLPGRQATRPLPDRPKRVRSPRPTLVERDQDGETRERSE
jgi:hypothetical protein